MNRLLIRLLVVGAVALGWATTCAYASRITTGEMASARRWADRPPFSFVYGGRTSDEFLDTWVVEKTSRKLDKNRCQRELMWTDPKTNLVVKCVIIEYRDYPTVEWTLYFENKGQNDTPIIENIQALDTRISRRKSNCPADEFVLHHFVGSPSLVSDYQPLESKLGPNEAKRLAAEGGRATAKDMSYCNLQWGEQGLIIAVGWPGQWAATFARDGNNGLRICAGQELTHFKLYPREEVRSPMMVLQPWKGDLGRSYNIWRRWMVAYNIPRPGGKLPEPELSGCSAHVTNDMWTANEENQKEFIDRYVEEGLKIGHWWMDYGWCPTRVGTWEVDKKRFPNGLRAVIDYAHSKGIKTILWFEPERVCTGTWLMDNRRGWVTGDTDDENLLNLGNPGALNWITDHIDRLISDQGIDVYRQDLNMKPLSLWRSLDAPDRQGIAEIKHVTGYLAYWDELLRRHPDMLIDSCASGGRRNDLESMRRGIPLWRSDYAWHATGSQCHTYGISFWLPLSGTGVEKVDSYDFRSNMAPFTNCVSDLRDKNLDYSLLRRLWKEFYSLKRYWTGDYYPLTPYSTEENAWMAWQFDCPEIGEGMIQAFRRSQVEDSSRLLKLHGLEPKAMYRVRNLDEEKDTIISGLTLMKSGVQIDIPTKPVAVVITYKREK